ncbi:MAG: sulfite exporter TauE/SafE family protein [Firmicutes bacterium]|nr:sulfite exporter TauE/SafE family protein [Bacillota bacterium]
MLFNYEGVSIFINPYFILLLGLCIGIMGAYFGSKSMFITLPALSISGIPIIFALGTDLAHSCGRSLFDCYRYKLLKSINWYLVLVLSVFSVIGLLLSLKLILWLETYSLTDIVVRSLYAFLLTGLILVLSLLHKNLLPNLKKPKLSLSSTLNLSMLILIVFGVSSGFLTGLIGSGVLLLQIPILIYLFNLTTPVIFASNLLAFLVTSSFGVILWSSNGLLGLLTTLLLLFGVVIGSQIGHFALGYIPSDKVSDKTKNFLVLMSAAKALLAVMSLMLGYIKFAKLLIMAAMLTPAAMVITFLILERMARYIMKIEADMAKEKSDYVNRS